MAMPTKSDLNSKSCLTTDAEFLSKLSLFAKPKSRSQSTWNTIHIPELNFRLDLNPPLLCAPLSFSSSSTSIETPDPFTPVPDLENKSRIEVVYLGNSMLERLKSTGEETRLGRLGRGTGAAWNVAVGGDTGANIVGRLVGGLFDVLKRNNAPDSKAHDVDAKDTNMDIKLWILASGTNDLTKKRKTGFRPQDIEAYKIILETCLRIAPRSRVLACDVFYRKDIQDEIVDKGNAMLEEAIGEVNREFDGEKVTWVQARGKIGTENLVDHVHLDKLGYEIWDGVLWPLVVGTLGEDPIREETVRQQ